jgi:hypothetical protein
MLSTIPFNFDYDKIELLNLFNNADKQYLTKFNRTSANLELGIAESELFSRYFNEFPFISKFDLNIEIIQITGNARPHINPGNNGFLILPISGNPLIVGTYSYVTPYKFPNSDRPMMDVLNMSPETLANVESTFIESISVTQPTAVNGLRTFSFSVNDEPHPIVLLLKIPKTVDWSTVYNHLKQDTYANAH